MTPIIKDRNGKIQKIDPPRETGKKLFKVNSSAEMVHMLDGSVKAAVIPLGHTEQADKKTNPRLSKRLFKGKGHANPRKGLLGACAADYIPYNIAMTTGQNLLTSGKNPIIGAYIILSVNTGLRTSDVQNLMYSDFIGKKHGDVIRIQEKKTKKTREIPVNNAIVESFAILYKWYLSQNDGKFTDDFIFLSQKNMIYTTYSLNRILKGLFGNIVRNVSTHSLRKSFSREVYERANRKGADGLSKLNKILGHSNHSITLRYIGITKEEIADCYLSLDE